MVRALERWRAVGRYDKPSAWVYRVAMNWATSWRRKWGRRPTLAIEQLERPSHDAVHPDLHRLLAGLRPSSGTRSSCASTSSTRPPRSPTCWTFRSAPRRATCIAA